MPITTEQAAAPDERCVEAAEALGFATQVPRSSTRTREAGRRAARASGQVGDHAELRHHSEVVADAPVLDCLAVSRADSVRHLHRDLLSSSRTLPPTTARRGLHPARVACAVG